MVNLRQRKIECGAGSGSSDLVGMWLVVSVSSGGWPRKK